MQINGLSAAAGTLARMKRFPPDSVVDWSVPSALSSMSGDWNTTLCVPSWLGKCLSYVDGEACEADADCQLLPSVCLTNPCNGTDPCCGLQSNDCNAAALGPLVSVRARVHAIRFDEAGRCTCQHVLPWAVMCCKGCRPYMLWPHTVELPCCIMHHTRPLA